MIEHTAWLYNRYETGRYGVTPYAAVQFHNYDNEVYAFCQVMRGRLNSALIQPTLQARWITGIWFGRRGDTDEHVVGTDKGVFCTRTVVDAGIDEQKVDYVTAMLFSP